MRQALDEILDLLTHDEVADALRFVEAMERGRHMGRAEADEWRRRIIARQRFLELDEHSSPVRALS